MKTKTEVERVWLLCGVALAALFLLRTAGMIFQGAITGFGMYVALFVLLSWFPPLKKLLFSMGGIFDILVSFGLPYCISVVLGINGGTMLIATMTCGLLFTFSIATKRLGGPIRAASKTTKMVVRDSLDSFESWRKEIEDGRRNQVGSCRDREHHHPRSRGECQEGEEEGSPRGSQVIDMR